MKEHTPPAPDTPLSVLIVDDEAPARERLRDLLGDIAERHPTRLVGMAANGIEALALLDTTPADLILTDIRMPAMDGIELARHTARLDPPPAVIFTTAYDEYAVRAFELAAVDYLLKPVRAARLAEALAKARRLHPPADTVLRQIATAGRSHFSVSERGRILLVPVPEVLYLKAEQKYVVARCVDREYLLDESLVQLEEEFPERFLRIHRNCLIARHAVRGVARATTSEDGEAHWVILLDGLPDQLPVSRRQWPTVKDALGV
ncbi:MAG TPA: LytTR family DNA-binding domain-containing protein [Zoogloea sp.]|uniref:LytR/AlgR family response regulator transcription factor n=1 Tax=Zoogloea sp. TaxID=49181 RepID=UPI002C583BCB|nr:LytTR family DNA-binding domain-containing protein [Zoogloea sp.]HMW53785.1 LytTR family DNA-binding domain-containing protein [Rhodocyclaceae bacterium]HMY51277.1 LytTR family DNA-binding domain-containing protein [Rhodocyclaceae bacterium]HNA68278.1 LytTR family DNA-binding domain-containing protein [Rhodocyclaceae bacterium]HNB65851.1 LytTR family DNA-binding domain-containing protein [Rhodocyclaceae bacterium]HNF63281.1 LytTR family DNA-binding domain-containing protein [Rhodocyclaceae 